MRTKTKQVFVYMARVVGRTTSTALLSNFAHLSCLGNKEDGCGENGEGYFVHYNPLG